MIGNNCLHENNYQNKLSVPEMHLKKLCPVDFLSLENISITASGESKNIINI